MSVMPRGFEAPAAMPSETRDDRDRREDDIGAKRGETASLCKAFLDKFGAFCGSWKHIESDARQLADELVTQASDRGAQATAFTLASLRNVLDARHSKKQRKEKNNLTNEQRAVWAQVMALAPIALTEEQRVAVEAKRAAAQRLLVGKQLERERRAVAAELGPTIGSGNGSGSGSGSVGGSGGSGSVELIQSSADVHTCAMLAAQAEAPAARAEAAAALKESARLSELLSIEREENARLRALVTSVHLPEGPLGKRKVDCDGELYSSPTRIKLECVQRECVEMMPPLAIAQPPAPAPPLPDPLTIELLIRGIAEDDEIVKGFADDEEMIKGLFS